VTGVLKEITANAFCNYTDHVMDNDTRREIDPTISMPMAVAANVGRPHRRHDCTLG
jgi:hypothetical protein